MFANKRLVPESVLYELLDFKDIPILKFNGMGHKETRKKDWKEYRYTAGMIRKIHTKFTYKDVILQVKDRHYTGSCEGCHFNDGTNCTIPEILEIRGSCDQGRLHKNLRPVIFAFVEKLTEDNRILTSKEYLAARRNGVIL